MSRNYVEMTKKKLSKTIGGMQYFKQRRQRKNNKNFRRHHGEWEINVGNQLYK